MRSLQKLLLGSWSARCLAVRQVTQDNRGKKTPGFEPNSYGLGFAGCGADQAKHRVATGQAVQVLTQKDSGQTAHVERWNGPLRQRCSRYVRRTLSFSKVDRMHHLATKYFVWHYNLDCIINTL